MRANADDVDISGYLKLWRKKTKQWRTLWFVLKDKAFYTYKASEVGCLYRLRKLSFFVPKIHANIGTRTFSVAASTRWNILPSSVRSVENIAKFS